MVDFFAGVPHSLDRPLDQLGTASLLVGRVEELLRHLADRFPQVILITHIESVKDGVDRVLRVELDESRGVAVVTDDQEIPGGEGVAA